MGTEASREGIVRRDEATEPGYATFIFVGMTP